MAQFIIFGSWQGRPWSLSVCSLSSCQDSHGDSSCISLLRISSYFHTQGNEQHSKAEMAEVKVLNEDWCCWRRWWDQMAQKTDKSMQNPLLWAIRPEPVTPLLVSIRCLLMLFPGQEGCFTGIRIRAAPRRQLYYSQRTWPETEGNCSHQMRRL